MPPTFQQILPFLFCSGHNTLPVCRPAICPNICSLSLHQGSGPCAGLTTLAGYSHSVRGTVTSSSDSQHDADTLDPKKDLVGF